MRDIRTEDAIKSVTVFLEFWTKFHAMYDDLTARGTITTEDEAKFLAVRDSMKKKYAELAGALDFTYTPHGRMTDPVSDVLACESIRFMSEKHLKKIAEDWRDSYVFLNSILERLKSKKRRLGPFSPLGVFLKKFREKISGG